MHEYIVRETDCGLATKQEIVGQLVRCKDCRHWETDYIPILSNYFIKGSPEEHMCSNLDVVTSYDFYCGDGEVNDFV